jgi:hypothetical protein
VFTIALGFFSPSLADFSFALQRDYFAGIPGDLVPVGAVIATPVTAAGGDRRSGNPKSHAKHE